MAEALVQRLGKVRAAVFPIENSELKKFLMMSGEQRGRRANGWLKTGHDSHCYACLRPTYDSRSQA